MNDTLDSSSEFSGTQGKPLSDLIAHGYTFEFGKNFETGFNIWKKDIGGMIGYTALSLLILMFSCITIVGPLFLVGPFAAGYFVVGEKIARGEPHEFSDYWKGFEFFGQTLLFHLVIAGIVGLFYLVFILVALMFPMSAALLRDPGSAAALGVAGVLFLFFFFLIAMVGGIYLQTVWFFVYPFICNGKLSCGQALKASRKVVVKNFWWFLLFSILVGMISGVGVYLLFVGLLVSYPLKYLLALGAYINTVGLGDKRQEVESL